MDKNNKLTAKQAEDLLCTLKSRFEANLDFHKSINWPDIEKRLNSKPAAMWSLYQMESTGGEPDVIWHDPETNEFVFCDCAAESPAGRRSLCYDNEALESRKANKPENSAEAMAKDMGITLLDENQYRELQKTRILDTKTSSWILTPANIRCLGGALFCDRRYNHIFVYHNGAESYYSSRGFRGLLKV